MPHISPILRDMGTTKAVRVTGSANRSFERAHLQAGFVSGRAFRRAAICQVTWGLQPLPSSEYSPHLCVLCGKASSSKNKKARPKPRHQHSPNLEPPERSATHKVIMEAALPRRRQREVRLSRPEIAYLAADAQLLPHLHIQSQPGLHGKTGRRFPRIRPAIQQCIVLAEVSHATAQADPW